MTTRKKLSSKQARMINYHIEKYGVSVDIDGSSYDAEISFWEIKIKKTGSKSCNMSWIANIIMKDLKVKDLALNGVVYHA